MLMLALLAALSWPRHRDNFDSGWRFHLGDLPNASAAACADAGWREVQLPHDWSIEGEFDERNPSGPQGGYLPGGIAWYRKHFQSNDKRAPWVLLEFDGIARRSQVWLNGQLLGGRPYGYSSFSFPIAQWLREGDNVLAVRVDDREQPDARWHAGCGIDRHVWITEGDSLHVAQNGIGIATPSVCRESAVVNVAVRMENQGAVAETNIVCTVLDPLGREMGQTRWRGVVPKGGAEEVTPAFSVNEPQCWSPDHPELYRLKVEIAADDGRTDTVDVRFGIRTFRFDAQTGFWLNGAPLKWRGMCLHEDAGALGAVMPDVLIESRLRQLKTMGVNAVRTAHNPMPPEFYDVCDRLGLMVMDEAFDGWHAKAEFDYGALDFSTWWRRDLTDLILRDRNHPSVILWSVGNETGKADVVGITALAHRLDPSRPTTGGQVLEGIDVAGWNGPGELQDFVGKWSRQKPMIFTEAPHTLQTRGYYRTQTWWRDEGKPHWPGPNLTEGEIFHDDFAPRHPHKVTYNSSYDNAAVRINIRQSLSRTRDTGFISGENRWTAFDYLGESAGWPLRMGNFGVIDSCGFPKDAYYLYQSQWTTAPMVHLLPHWTHPDLAARTVIPVWAYTNCDRVELFLNGRSLGERTLGRRWFEMNAAWNVPYEPGTLRAVGWRGGRRVTEDSERTAGDPVRLRLSSDRSQLAADGEDLAQISVAVEDRTGDFCPLAADRVHFVLRGPGLWRGADNGDPADLDNLQGRDRRVFYGLCKAYVGGGSKTGAVALGAAAILGDLRPLAKRRVAIDVRWISLRGSGQTPEIDARFTTDGTDPRPTSPRYNSPFLLRGGGTVKAVLFEHGTPILWLQQSFPPEGT